MHRGVLANPRKAPQRGIRQKVRTNTMQALYQRRGLTPQWCAPIGRSTQVPDRLPPRSERAVLAGPRAWRQQQPSPGALRRLDREVRELALARSHAAPANWFLSLNIPRWISRLRPGQALPSLRQLQRSGIDPARIVFEITELGGASQRLPGVVALPRSRRAHRPATRSTNWPSAHG